MWCAATIRRLGALAAGATLLAACAGPSDPDESPATEPPTDSAAPTGTRTDAPATQAPPGGAAEWEALTDAPFARLEMATAVHEGRVWLAGGLAPNGEALAEVSTFDPSDGSWSDGPALPEPVHHAALVSDGERLVLIGGYVGSGFDRPTDRSWVLEPDAEDWSDGPPLPAPRAAGAAAWDGSRIAYAGGVGPSGVTDGVMALAGGAWQGVGALPSGPREHLAAASDGEGRVWLLGGRVGGLDSNVAHVALVDGSEVSALADLPTPRGGVAAFFVPGVGACLTGGEAPDRAFRAVECIDAEGRVTTLAEMRVERHGHGAAAVDGTAYVLLGGPEPGLSAHASVEALDLGGIGR